MLKIVLFDHDDLDAAGCRIVFELAYHCLQKDVDYTIVHCSNNNVDELVIGMIDNDNVDENTEIFFTDICASREVLETLVSKFKNVMIWDHHRTNFFATWIIPEAVIIPENSMGMLESGTSLLFKHFSEIAEVDFTDPRSLYFIDSKDLVQYIQSSKYRSDIVIPAKMIEVAKYENNFKMISSLVDNIRSYDTYEWKDTNNLTAKKLQTLFFLLGMDRFCNRYVNKFLNNNSGDLISESDMDFVDSKLEYEQKVIDSIGMDNIYDVSIKGLRSAFILNSAGANISEVAYQFLTNHPEFDMFLGFSFARGGEYSFRCTRDDLNLGEIIAAPIGGGGHPKASGAPIPDEIKDQVIRILLSGVDSEFYMN